jgi:cytochrome c oxidase subunit 2
MSMMLDPVSFQLPDDFSTHGKPIDTLFGDIFWMSVAFFVAIVGAMIYFCWKYRRRPGHKAEPTGHNQVLEIGWTVAPIPILIWLFHEGFLGYMGLSLAPAGAIEIQVKANQWNWAFVYPNGESADGSDPKQQWCEPGEPCLDPPLHIPVNKPVKLVMSSADVIHAFYVPELRAKRDLVPGMYSSMWFKATRTTDPSHPLDLFCAQYCGGKSTDPSMKQACDNGNAAACDHVELPSDIEHQGINKGFVGHFSMRTKVIIESEDQWNAYVQSLEAPPGAKPEDIGKKLYGKFPCHTCHSVDGSSGAAPTWKGLFGKTEKLNNGTEIVVDENYVRRSILDPSADIVSGYPSPSPMPKVDMKDAQIDQLIAYIKTLK